LTYKRWANDGVAQTNPGQRFGWAKEYELKLLAGLARCYRGEISLRQLPLIPQTLADHITKAGGLGPWLVADPRRRAKFEKMVERQQAEPTAPRPAIL